MLSHDAGRRVRALKTPAPPMISATPLAYTSALLAGSEGGMMPSYQVGATKCITPAAMKKDPKVDEGRTGADYGRGVYCFAQGK